MRILLSFLLLGSLVSAAKAQTADDVIGKYVEAMGGLEKLKSIKSVYIEGVSVSPNGAEITTKTYKVQDKLYRQDINFGMGSFTMIVTDKEGWFSNPRNNGAFEPLTAEAIASQQHELDCAGPLADYASKGHKAELIGLETIDGKECYNVKLTLKSGRAINYYIDNKNWYIIRTSAKGGGGMMGGGGGNRQAGGEVELKTSFSDFKKQPMALYFP
jgi:outer membrane lipoprotein-sorting protein